ncbi:hypothetical protein AAC387_Pa04g1087 [Persea americana]
MKKKRKRREEEAPAEILLQSFEKQSNQRKRRRDTVNMEKKTMKKLKKHLLGQGEEVDETAATPREEMEDGGP